MGPLSLPLKKAASLFLIFCLLPWQEPASVFASEPSVAAPAAEPAALALDGLPPEIQSQVGAILKGPKGDVFLGNARKAKLPEIQARLTQLSGEDVDPTDSKVAASRAELKGWLAGALSLKHDWKGDAESEAAYASLLSQIQKRHDDLSSRLDARAATAPLVGQLREQLKGGPELEHELKSFQRQLSAYMKSGSDADMGAAVGAMDALYQKAGIHDDAQRARMFAQIGATAREQGDALAVRAGAGDGRPFSGYQGAVRKVSDLGFEVPNVAPTAPAAPSGPSGTQELRDAVGAAESDLKTTVLGGLVPGVDLRALADKAARLADRLEAATGGAQDVATRTVGAAYDAISNEIMQLIDQAPDASTADARALAAWRKKWSDLQDRLLDRGGKTGPEWAAAEKLWADHPEAQAGAAASRGRAQDLRRMVAAFVDKGIDPTAVSHDLRGKLLTGDGGSSGALGLVTQALFHDQDANGAKLKTLLSRLQEMGLLAPGADPQKLAQFYDGEGNADLFKGTALEGIVARWAEARKPKAAGAAGGGPTADELAGQVLEQFQFLGASVLPEKDDAKKQAALLYLRQYN
ncbi:MAG TPA: hypothetical protein VH309_13740, partial [Elusimicrobiota bacterium]|nr:hypothetical protein [Elusimicrobiota bacterium]